MAAAKKKIGEILKGLQFVTEENIQMALSVQALSPGKRLGEILMESNVITEQQLAIGLGHQYMLPVMSVSDYINNIEVQNEVPHDMMERLNVFPLEFQDHNAVILIAISDPTNSETRKELRASLGYKLRFAIAPASEIAAALKAGRAEPAAQTAPQMTPAAPQMPQMPTAAPAMSQMPQMPPAAPTVPQMPQMAPAAPTMPQMQQMTPAAPTMPQMPQTPPAAQTVPQMPQAAPQIQKPPAPQPSIVAPQDTAIVPSFSSLRSRQPRLGDILVQAGAITEEQLVNALQLQRSSGKKLGEILVSEGILEEIKLAEALSTQLKLPMFTLTRYRPDPEAIRLVPRNMAERLDLIPLKIEDNDTVLVAMSNPLDLLAQDEVRMYTSRNIRVGITTKSEINNNLDRLYNLQSNLSDAVLELDDTTAAVAEAETGKEEADDAPVIQIVSQLLQQAVREGASDIHVEIYEKLARVRFRVDGQLYTAFEYPVALHPSVAARLKIMSGMDIAEKRKPQDGRILIRVDGRRVDLRVSDLPTMNGEKMVLRILDQSSTSVGLEKLGLEDDDMEKILKFCNMPWGVMLVTGPTGSGKSTTLYSILQKVNTPDVNIITVEDPVEFSVAGINQVHVNEKAGLTFEAALRSILRQDPDKVMVGEIRDSITAQIAIRAALTGHFVLSTLHTNDAPSTATRIVDMGVAPFLVSASLSGVVAQRLVRRLCPACREEYELPNDICDDLGVPHGSHAFKPKGCNECRNGYKGRRGIYEIMMMNDELRKLVLNGANNMELRKAAIANGMKTLRRSAVNAAMKGVTSIEEVLSTTQ